jgi:hypothetical protein
MRDAVDADIGRGIAPVIVPREDVAPTEAEAELKVIEDCCVPKD